MDSYNKLFMIIRKTDLLNYDEKNDLQLYLLNLQEQVKKQKEVIDKAIEKLYCWIEVLDPIFQKEMLDILKEVSE